MTRFRRLLIENLEDRCVPANWGTPWPDAEHLTLSFVPDGTLLGQGQTQTSTLFQTLNAIAPTAVWERDILLAFQTWAVNANINIGLVGDSGQALGTAGPPQGDPNFGAIRVAAGAFGSAANSPSELAFTQPYDPTVGTWSGDVQLNTDMPIGVSSSAAYDFETLMLHEAGHSFGLPDNDVPTSVMYATYNGVDTTLSASDIANLQALYGPRNLDPYGSDVGKGTLAKATALSLAANANGILSVGVSADLATMSDVDVYRFTAPLITGGLVIQLQHDGLSLLTPQVTVYNSLGQVVGSAESTDPTAGDLTIQVNSLLNLGTYYVKVQGASGTVFDIGSYKLNIASLPIVNGVVQSVLSTLATVDQDLNSILAPNTSFATATNLSWSSYATGAPVTVAHQASINLAGQANYYIVQAPAQSTGDNVLTVTLWADSSSQLDPSLSIFDANEDPVSAQVLSNEGGAVTLQLADVTPGASYYFKVASAVNSGAGSTGNYTISANFGANVDEMQTLASSQLTAQTPQQSGTLDVELAGVFHFVLAVPANSGTGVNMTILDSNGNLVQQLAVSEGNTESVTITLIPGTYTVELTAFTADGDTLQPVQFTLWGTSTSGEMGSLAIDTSSSSSSGSGSSNNTSYQFTSGSTTVSGPAESSSTGYTA